MDTNMVLNTSFNELVFENRHKNYGAYQIRKRYSRNVLLAGFLAVVFFSAMLATYFINGPKANATTAITQPKVSDTLVMILHPDQPKQQEQQQTQPRAPKGSAAITSNIVITRDSVAPITPSDTIGVANGKHDGPGKLTDTVTVKIGPPCLNCDTHKVKRRNWLPNPPKDPGLDEFFRKNIHYPVMAKEQGIEGVVYLSFVVDTKGDVKEIQIAKGANPLLDKEVLRVAKMMPKWEPVKDENGDIIEYQYSKPVRFTLAK